MGFTEVVEQVEEVIMDTEEGNEIAPYRTARHIVHENIKTQEVSRGNCAAGPRKRLVEVQLCVE
jgi:hypothetical protein